MKDEAMKQALEALELSNVNHWWGSSSVEKAITALREALAEQPAQQYNATSDHRLMEQPAQQEPVGEVLDERGEVDWISFVPPAGTSLYTSPQPCPTCEALARTVMLDQTSHDNQRKPLTDEQIDCLYRENNDTPGFNFSGFARRFARAIEAKLKEKNT